LREGGKLASWLEGNPHWIAFDKTAFDAKCSTYEHIMVSRFFYDLSIKCGYTQEDADMVFRLCMSSIYPTRSIKTDLFMLTCSMPTGFWMTIHFNCVRSSLQSRYAWCDLRRATGLKPNFRSHVRQMCLGDDLVATVDDYAPWYNQIDIAKSLLSIGAIATSADKGKSLTAYDHRQFVLFLKRRITSVEGLVCWAIEEKTLIKMLCMRRSSKTLNVREAHAIILMNILAECWMYGREKFDAYHDLVLRLGLEHELYVCVNWQPHEFDTYVDKYRKGELITWEPNRSEELETTVLI